VQIFGITQANATNAINNTASGDGAFSLNDGGYYITGNDGTSASTKDLWTSSATVTSRKAGPVRFLSSLTVDGALDLGAMTDLASAATITLGTQSFYRLTGSTTIDTINSGTDARAILLTGPATGAVDLSTAGNIATSATLSSSSLVLMLYNPTAVKWITIAAAAALPAIQSVASAASVTLPTTGDVFNITGTTNITSIVATGNSGRAVFLKFAGTITVADGSNLILSLSSDFAAQANRTLSLVCDGTNWYEIGRSLN
jgi:hypothetical protein